MLQKQASVGAGRKRRRIADKPHAEERLSDIIELTDGTEGVDGQVEEQLQEELVGAKRRRGKK